MNKKDFYSLLEAVPKAELHIHSEAAVSKKSIKKLYAINTGKQMTKKQLDDLFAYDDLPGFLNCFISVQKLFTTTESLKFIFDDYRDYLNDNNIVYSETFFSPTSHLRNGKDFHEMISLLSEGIKIIKQEDNKKVKVIIDVSRSFGTENAMHNLDLVLKENNPDIIGIGLGGDEQKGPAKEYESVFRKARENNLHVVAHAGEVCPSISIKDSIKYLKAERIGHGISAVYDDPFMDELKETQLPLEVCPASNIFTNKYVHDIKEHPVKKLYDHGVFITLGTDDPTFFKVSLIDEYWSLYNKLNFSLADIQKVILNGFKAAFLSDSQKSKYCTQARKAWKDWFAQHPDVEEI